jgi:putative oxidoreductase
LQRLFSTFANGWPGRGLFFQRLLTAAVLFRSAVPHLRATAPLTTTVPYVFATLAGILLLFGLWTPVAGMAIAVTELIVLISTPAEPWVCIVLVALGATLAMIGPGAWSIDARLFGRKQIDISKPSS